MSKENGIYSARWADDIKRITTNWTESRKVTAFTRSLRSAVDKNKLIDEDDFKNNNVLNKWDCFYEV